MIDETEAAVVRRIFEMYAKDWRVFARRGADGWTALGAEAPRGGKVWDCSIRASHIALATRSMSAICTIINTSALMEKCQARSFRVGRDQDAAACR